MKKIIRLKGIVIEDLVNYKKPSMFLVTSTCNWKCCNEGGFDKKVCQNSSLISAPTKEIDIDNIVKLYLGDPLTQAVVIGGLEPFEQFEEIVSFIEYFRQFSEDDIVIYTGYYEKEIYSMVEELKAYSNIVIKFGRYVPNQKPHLDKELGINLASDNQYGKRIS